MYFPEFSISTSILTNIGKIEHSRAIISHTPLTPSAKRQLQREAQLNNMFHASRFEGSGLTLEQAKAYYNGKSLTLNPRTMQELENYKKAWSLVYDPQDISEELLKLLHQILLESIAPTPKTGVYRTITSATSPAPDEILAQLRGFLSWFESPDAHELPQPLRSAILYYELLRIQPFETENKKIAGIATVMNLANNDYEEIKLCSLESHFSESPTAFNSVFRSTYTNEGDITRWLEYFLQGLSNQFAQIKEKILAQTKDSKLKLIAGNSDLNERQERIIEYMHDYGSMQNRDFIRLLPDVSEDSILRDIKYLMAKNLLTKVGSTKSARYMLTATPTH